MAQGEIFGKKGGTTLGSRQEAGGSHDVRFCAGRKEQVAAGQGLYTAGC